MAFYMKIKGIVGDVSASNYEDWIELSSLRLGVGCEVNTVVGRAKNRHAYTPKFTNLTLEKSVDSATLLLFQAACEGDNKKTVLIHACRDANAPQAYLEYELENCVVCGYTNSGITGYDDQNSTKEILNLNFTKISLKFIGRDKQNQDAKALCAGYDLECAKAI